MQAIEVCRTAALGGHVDECDQCGHQVISYNSCRNRHCPKCQALEKAQWLKERQAELLPVEYFHVVFTIPEEIAAMALQNKRCVYDILFHAASQTLLRIAADPKHLGAEIGFLAVLHTWGQNLLHHPHVHCVVAGGGLSPDGTQWVSCREGFFLPVKVLSRLFRRLFLEALERAFWHGELAFHGKLQELAAPDRFIQLIQRARAREWVVYAKPPFGGPAQVLSYLGRYTHRVAISNDRLVKLEEGQVSFRWKDYRRGNQTKVMTLAASEFIRRYLMHVLPRGFQRLRHYGYLSNRHRAEKLERCRQLLGVKSAGVAESVSASTAQDEAVTDETLARCPVCRVGRMRCVGVLATTFAGEERSRLVPRWQPVDSS
jgi:putative transposase/transposase-like zinc-binding protein